MLPPSSDSAALVPTCPCPSTLCIAPSTSQGPGDPPNQDPKGGAVLPSQQLSQRGAGPCGSEQGPPLEVPSCETGQGTAPGRWELGAAPESAGIVSLGWTTLESSHESCGLWRQPPPGEHGAQGGPASTGHIIPPVDLGVANVLWAFPHGANSDPHWGSQGRQAFRAPLKASTSWVQLPEATPPGVPACLPAASIRPGKGVWSCSELRAWKQGLPVQRETSPSTLLHTPRWAPKQTARMGKEGRG